MTSQQTGRPSSEQATRETSEATTGGRHRLTEPTAPGSPTAPGPVTTTPDTRPQTQPEVRTDVWHAPQRYDDRGRLASYRRTRTRPPAARAGSIIVLIVGLSILSAQWDLYPTTYQGQSDASWALGFMIVSTGAALRILTGNPGRHAVSVAAILVCGVGFVLRAFLIGGGEPASMDAFEAVCGALLLLGGGLAAAWPALEDEPPAPTSPS